MRTRSLAIFSMLATMANAAGVSPAWIKHYTGVTQSRFNEAADSYLDTLTGSLYVVGAGELAANPGGTDLVVMKYRQDGIQAWVRGFSGSGSSPEDMAHAVAVDSVGNVYIAGMTDDDDYDHAAWAKYDSSGTELWHKSSGWAGNGVALDVTIGNGGDVYICGSDPGYGSLTGYMVARISPANGDTLWTRNYVLDDSALARGNRGQDLHPDYFDNYDLFDNVAAAIARSPDSGVVVTGHGLDFYREREWWTMKLTPSGVQSWAAVYHNPNTVYDEDDVAFDLAVAVNGDIYAVGFDYYEAGASYQGYNLAVVQYSPAGTRLNWRSVDVASAHGDDYAYSVALDDSSPQNVYVTGTLEYPSGLLHQVATMKLNSALTPRWGAAGATYGGASDDDRGHSVFYRKGRVYVTGLSDSDIVVLGYTASNATPKDTIWAYRYDGADHRLDFGASICASDSDDVFVSGEVTHSGTPPWTDIYTARLRYGNPDMAVTSIDVPKGPYDHYDTVVPRVTITNYGNVIPAFSALMHIGPYGDTVQVHDGPAPGQSAVVVFKPWPAHPVGPVAVRCSLELAGDLEPSNNFLSDTVQVLATDVGSRLIVSPVGSIDSGSTAVPVARYKNFGTTRQTFAVWFRIEATGRAATDLPDRRAAAHLLPIYEDSATISLAPQESANVSFSSWQASPPDTYGMKAFTTLFGDDNQTNDTVRAQLIVRPAQGIQSPEDLSSIPREYSLGSPRPNPFGGQTTVPFALPIRSLVSVRIYDAAGVLVRTLTAADLPAGFHHAVWNGIDERGLRVHHGAYFCRLQAPGYASIAKLIMSD